MTSFVCFVALAVHAERCTQQNADFLFRVARLEKMFSVKRLADGRRTALCLELDTWHRLVRR